MKPTGVLLSTGVRLYVDEGGFIEEVGAEMMASASSSVLFLSEAGSEVTMSIISAIGNYLTVNNNSHTFFVYSSSLFR